MNYADIAETAVELAEDAGREIMRVYATDFSVESKDDDSPLTKADLASNSVIVAGLESLSTRLPIITEEAGLPEFAERSAWSRYWLIDPLDGTKEFVNRNGELTVNIALFEDGVPVLGVVHVPVTGVTYVGVEGSGAERRDANGGKTPVKVSEASGDPVRVVGSRSHASKALDIYLDALGSTDLVPMGSSLKF